MDDRSDRRIRACACIRTCVRSTSDCRNTLFTMWHVFLTRFTSETLSSSLSDESAIKRGCNSEKVSVSDLVGLEFEDWGVDDVFPMSW